MCFMKLSQINIPFKDEVDDKIYATAIKQMKDLKNDERIDIIFTEIPVKELFEWMLENDISINQMREYYEKFIKSKGLRNKELEDFFEI